MKCHTLIDQEDSRRKDINSTQNRKKARNTNQNPIAVCVCVLHKLILTFTCKHKGLRTAKPLTKTKVGGFIKPNIQTCYKATVI